MFPKIAKIMFTKPNVNKIEINKFEFDFNGKGLC